MKRSTLLKGRKWLRVISAVLVVSFISGITAPLGIFDTGLQVDAGYLGPEVGVGIGAPLFNKESKDDADLYWINNIAGKMSLTEAKGGAWVDLTHLSKFETSLYGSRVYGTGRSWSVTFDGPKVNTSVTPDLEFCIHGSLGNGSGWMMAGDGNHATTFKEKGYQQQRTEWYPYVHTKAVFNGTGTSDLRDLSFVLADLTSPGEKRSVIYSMGQDAEAPVLWLDFGERLRAANHNITWDDLAAAMRLTVGIVPKDQPNDEIVYVTATATRHDGAKLGFQIVDEDWTQLVGGEFQIVNVASIPFEGEAFELYEFINRYNDKTPRYVETPMTDVAGNPVFLPANENVRIKNLTVDGVSPIVAKVDLKGSAAKEIATDPDGWPKDIDRSELFSTVGDTVDVTIEMDELLAWISESKREEISLEWNIQKAGAPVVTKLKTIEQTYASAFGKSVSVLVFETLEITADMTPQGEQIKPVMLQGTGVLSDVYGNFMTNTVDLADNNPNRKTYLDTLSPVMSLGDTIFGAEADGKKPMTIEFTISDGDGLTSSVMGGEGMLCLSAYDGAPTVKYKYEITRNATPPAELTKQGTLVGANDTYIMFPMTGTGSYYLHMSLLDVDAMELDNDKGLVIGGVFYDAAGNTSSADDMRYALNRLNIDHVTPRLSLIDRGMKISRNDTDETLNDASFKVSYEAEDLNSLDRLEYQWVPTGAEPTDNGWTILGNTDGGNAMSGTLERTASGTNKVSLTLYVRVYDRHGNMKQETLAFEADMQRVLGHQEYVGDSTMPKAENDILVTKPVSSDSTSVGGSYYTRAIVTFTDYQGEQNNYKWVRVFDFVDYDSAPLLSATNPDGTPAEWYCVQIIDDKYNVVYTGDELTGEKAIPLSHYGEIRVDFLSSAHKDSVVPVNFDFTIPTEDTSFHEDGSFVFQRTVPRNDVHDVTFGVIADRDGVTPSMNTFGGNKYCVFNRTMAGVSIPFTISNKVRGAFGYEDVDFENSYMVLLKAASNGDFAVVTDEVTSRMSLSSGTEQIFTVPSMDQTGNPFGTGAYVLQVHLVQKAGGVQDFFLSEEDMTSGEHVYLLLDASRVPDVFGITDYTVNSQVVFPSASGASGLPITKTAPDGEVISYVNVGVAQPTQTYNNRLDGTGRDTETIVSIDGHPAYALEVNNALQSAMEYGGGNLHLTLTAKPSDANTWLNYETGVVAGIKYWNSASSGNPRDLAYTAPNKSEENGQTVYHQSFYECLDWYTDYSDSSYVPNNVVVETKEELEARSIDQFSLLKGANTICYQLIMKNGVESPVYQFELNLFDQAPAFALDFELVNPKTVFGRQNGVDYWRTCAEQIHVKVVDAYSPYGALQFYRADYDYSTRTWGYTSYDAGESIPLTMNGDGYAGIASTRKDIVNEHPMDQFVFAVDSVGNAVCAYPILDASDEITDARFYYGVGTVPETRVDVEPAWSEYEGAFKYDANRIIFNRNATINAYKTVEYFTVQVDDREPIRIHTRDDEGTFVHSGNSAGVVDFGPDMAFGVQITPLKSFHSDTVRFDLPYDPAIPEGQMVEHVITVVTYEYADENGNRKETTHSQTIISPNTKPKLQYEDETITGEDMARLGAVYLTSSQNLQQIYPPTTYNAYKTSHILNIGGNGIYTVVMRDKYGEEYTFELPVDYYPEDPKIEFSTVESEADPTVDPREDLTTGAVTVTLTSDTYLLDVNEEYFDSEYCSTGKIIGDNTKNVTLTYYENGFADVTLHPIGANTEDPEYAPATICIYVNNIVKKPSPVLHWSYTGEAMAENDVVYHEISVSLMDAGEKELIDPITGQTPEHTFYIGANKGDTYTFSGYTDEYGIVGDDVIASLPYHLRKGPVFDDAGEEIIPVADTFAPDMAVTGYTIRKGISNEVKAAYKLMNDRTDANIFVGLPGYEDEGRYGAANLYTNIDAFLYRMGWGDAYSFRIDVADESETRLFVKAADTSEAPDYASGTSDSMEGVSLQGRTVIVDQNTEFVLYAVDKENNASAIPFVIDKLGVVPVPNVSQVLMKDNTVRLFLNLPIDGVTELTITNAERALEEDQNSAFYGQWYLSQATNDEVTLYYSYQYEGVLYTGSVEVTVSGIDETPFEIVDPRGTWSASYDASGKKLTNQEISGQFVFTKPIRYVEVVSENGEPRTTPDGVSVSWLDDRLTVIYEKNTEAIKLKITAQNGKICCAALPAVTTIDTVAPTVTVGDVKYTNGRQAEISVSADESVLLQELNGLYKGIHALEAGVSHTVTVGKNGTMTLRFTDKAGNITLKTVVIDQIVDTPLIVTVTKGGELVVPETDAIAVGDVLAVETNRSAEIYFNGMLIGTANESSPVNVTVGKDASGLYPAIRAVDTYGNAVLLQFLRIPMGDQLPPNILCTRNVITASVSTTDEALKALLLGNMAYADETTPTGNLAVDFLYTRPDGAGIFDVLCIVTDAAGNKASKTVTVRLYNGEEPVIYVDHSGVKEGTPLDALKALWDESVIVSAGKVTLDVRTNGEPYKIVYKKGIKTAAQMKRGAEILTEYTENQQMVYQLDLHEPGYYTIVMTTQGRMTYRIVLYVEE